MVSSHMVVYIVLVIGVCSIFITTKFAIDDLITRRVSALGSFINSCLHFLGVVVMLLYKDVTTTLLLSCLFILAVLILFLFVREFDGFGKGDYQLYTSMVFLACIPNNFTMTLMYQIIAFTVLAIICSLCLKIFKNEGNLLAAIPVYFVSEGLFLFFYNAFVA